MYYYKSCISYEGTHYAGFQWQKDIPTIQGDFNLALSHILDGKFSTMAASRTDTGVHAFYQVVKITTEQPIDQQSFTDAINKKLSRAVRCNTIESCQGNFKPSVDSISKEYRYFFTNKISVPTSDRVFISNISKNLDIEAMKVCLDSLKGCHDFKNFYSEGSNVRSTIRTILECDLHLVNPKAILSKNNLFEIPIALTECYQLRFIADGFLKQMIRHFVAALWCVGTNKMSVDDFLILLDGEKNKKQLWKVAPPNGLFLYNVTYES